MPGQTQVLVVTPDRVADTTTDPLVRVQCSQICGAGHAEMQASVRVVAKADFDEWVEARSGAGHGMEGMDMGGAEADHGGMEGMDQMPTDGQMPMDQQMPMDGQMPMDQQMPMDGQMPMDQQMQMDEPMPGDKQMPMDQQMQMDGQMPMGPDMPATDGN